MKSAYYYCVKATQRIKYICDCMHLERQIKKSVFKNGYRINLNHYTTNCNHYGRVPKDVAKKMPHAFQKNNKYNAGAQVTLLTDSNELKIFALYKDKAILKNMDLRASSGIDVCIESAESNEVFTLFPLHATDMAISNSIKLQNGLKKISLFYPSYAEVKSLEVFSSKPMEIINKSNYPLVFYGSSITQGCSSSTPSRSYSNMVGRMMDRSVENYGFSESAHGEQEIVSFISKRPTDAFIIEYDHNATLEQLESTHKKIYKELRANNKSALIVFISRMSGGLSISNEENDKRIRIIQSTVDYSKDLGDEKVFFINGSDILPSSKETFFVDGKHPNDKGMELLAIRIVDALRSGGLS